MRTWVFRHGVRLVGPLLLVLVLWKAGDVRALVELLGRVSAGPLVLACLLNGANVHLKVERTRLLAGLRGLDYPRTALWKGMLPSLYLGMVTPGRVGDALRIQYMRRDLGTSYAEGLALIVMDRFCDLYVLLAFVAAGVAHFASVLTGRLGTITWLGVLVTAVFPLAFLVRGPAEFAMGLIKRKFPAAGGDAGERFLEALRGQMRPKLGWAVPLTVGAFLINYLQGWLASRALGLELAYSDVIFMMAITSLLGLLPISMSGAGVRELFMALVFPSLGFAREQGIAFGLLIFAVIYLFCSLVGLVAWQLAPPPFDVQDAPAEGDARSRLAASPHSGKKAP